MPGSLAEWLRRRLPGHDAPAERTRPNEHAAEDTVEDLEDFAVCPDAALRHAAGAAPRLFSWSRAGVSDPRKWHALAHPKLVELAGHGRFGGPPGIVGRQDLGRRDGLCHQSLYVRIRHGNDIPIRIVYAPDVNAGGPRPAVICLQDDSYGMHVSWGEARSDSERRAVADGFDIARQVARHGSYAVCIELAGVGERARKAGDADTAATTAHALVLGRCLPGDHASDVSSVLNWMLDGDFGLPFDAAAVPVLGIGAGGFAGLLAGALDIRVAGVAAIDCVGFLRTTVATRSLDFAHVIPGLLRWMDLEDVIALCAPRPVLVMAGRDHPRWPAVEAAQAVQDAGRIYDFFGAGGALAIEAVDGPRGLNTEALWRLFPRMLATADDAPPSDGGNAPHGALETRPRAR